MYYVMKWEDDTNPVSEHVDLNSAKKACRAMGHTGEDNTLLTGYPPIAYVADNNGYCVYNPRFAKLAQ